MAAMNGLTLTTPDVVSPISTTDKKKNSSSSAPPTDERIRELESKINGGQVSFGVYGEGEHVQLLLFKNAHLTLIFFYKHILFWG